VSARTIEHPVADVLRVLAVSHSSGALEVRGPRGGTFFLHEGDITYAEAPGVPPVEEFDSADPGHRSTIQSAIVEVGLNLLVQENATGERPLFRPGRRHWSGRAIRVTVDALLSEIAGQLAFFADLGVQPDDQVRLRDLSPGRIRVISRQQWAVAVQLSTPRTVRLLARHSGRSLGATIETVATLVADGMAISEPASGWFREPAPMPVPVAVPVRGRLPEPGRTPVEPGPEALARDRGGRPAASPDDSGSGPPPARLSRRIPGASTVPPSASGSPRNPPVGSPSPDEADDGRALVLRLLEGLRRL
jgi:hypothetical protein